MNKKATLILTLSLTLFLMTSAVSAESMLDFSSDESNSTNTDDKFIMGFNLEFPPFEYTDDNGNYAGFDIDLAKEVCERNNWTFVPLPIIDWSTKEFELNSDEINCVWSGFTMNGRENEYTWSEPYFNNTPVVVVKSDSKIENLDDLKGKSIELERETAVYGKIKNDTALKDNFDGMIEVDGYDAAFSDLDSGICDAVISDYGIANYMVAEEYPDCRILDITLPDEQYGIGFEKGNTELRDQVQKTLDEMFKDGTVDKIAQNYSKYNIPERVIHP